MSILLFGSTGQVGTELCRTLLLHGSVKALDRRQVDLTDQDALRRSILDGKPEVIVNAAAYTAVDRAESEPETADAINHIAPKVMAECAEELDCLLVHYSTDYVFDGLGSGPYKPEDHASPKSVYGKTKLAGEQAIEQSGCPHLIFRTSWVYSVHGRNFVKTMLKLGQSKESLSVVSDQIGAPTSAELIADTTSLAIGAYRNKQLEPGLYHLTASGETSWHGFADFIFKQAHILGYPLKLDLNLLKPISTTDYPTPASRPVNCRLDCKKLESILQINLPDWSVHARRTVERLVKQQ